VIIAYFDPFSGASGDMVLGALLDSGLSLRRLRQELARLPLEGYSLSARKIERHGIAATKLTVKVKKPQGHHRHLPDIVRILRRSDLPGADIAQAEAVFGRLAEAEARVHRCELEEVHFHEVGAVDAIVDIVGAVVALRLLGVEKVLSGPLRTGTGSVACAHGVLPVPAPATAELLRGVPSVGTDIQGELTTPTGAALLTTLAAGFGPRPPMAVRAVGYGAGSAERDELPNILRVFVGEALEADETDTVEVIEANLDDVPGEVVGHVVERALAAGALDAYVAPVYMKKNRPGMVVTLIAEAADAPRLEELLLAETTTFGVRRNAAVRRKLRREWATVETPFGQVRVKVGYLGKRLVQAAPEFEDCRRAADRHNQPLRAVYEAALEAFHRSQC